jgi:MFS family permease
VKDELSKTIWLFYLSKFLVGLRFFIPIWLIFGKNFLNLPNLGLLESAGYALTILVDIPSGAVADIIGRRKVIMLSLLLLALGHIGQGLSWNIPSYIIWGLIATIAGTFMAGSDTALVYDTLKEKGRDREFIKINGKALFANRMGIVIATFLGGFLYSIHTSLPFILMGMAEFLSIFCWYFMNEPKLEHIKFSLSNYVLQMKLGILQVTKNSYVKSLSVFYVFVGGITLSSLYFFNYSYALDLGFDASQQSLLFGFTGIVKALIVLVFAKYAHKFTKIQIYLIFLLFMLLSYLPAMFVGRNLALTIITFTEMLAVARFAFLDKFINDEFESKYRATSLSFMDMLVNVVYIVIVTAGGFIANSFGTAHLYSLIGLLVLVLVAPVTYKLVTSEHNN